jgi:hypothetical protein
MLGINDWIPVQRDADCGQRSALPAQRAVNFGPLGFDPEPGGYRTK